MKRLLLAGFLSLFLVGCGHAIEETEKVVGCTLNGECDQNRGPHGQPGAPGTDGANGRDGFDCSLTSVAPGPLAPYGGALVFCGVTSYMLTNGAPGANGPQGEPGQPGASSSFTITNAVTPCPGLAGSYRELLLILANGAVVSSFSDKASGQNTRLSLLEAGTFVTTDGRSCQFTVSNTDISWVQGGAGSVGR